MASSRLSLRYFRCFTTSLGDATTTVVAAAPSPDTIFASQSKTILRKVHDPDEALEIYSSVSHHDASTGFSDIETLVDAQRNDAIVNEELFYSTVIRSFGLASKFGHAMHFFKEMDRGETRRSTLSFNTLLNACLHCGKFDKVPQLFDEIPQRYRNIIPDKISYGILIKSYCDSGSHEKAIEIMRQIMEGKGMEEATTIAFTTILNSLYKKGEVEVAENLWNEMVKKGCEIDNAAYNVRIMNAAQTESPERVMELIQEMSTMGLKPDTNSYNYLMTAYCEKGMLDEAKKMYEGLQGNNAATFRTLIKSYCDSGLHEQAIEIMRQMMEGKGMEVTTIAFTTILNSLYKKGEVKAAENLWNEMVKKGCEMDKAAYNVRIMNAAQTESPERVLELIEEMSTMGLKPDTISYNCLMTAYCEKEMLDEAKKVYVGLELNRCIPNAATFRILIFHLCSSGLYEQGYKVFKKSARMYKIPDFNTLQHLVVGLVRNEKINYAKGVIITGKKRFPPSFLNAWKKLEEELGLQGNSCAPVYDSDEEEEYDDDGCLVD